MKSNASLITRLILRYTFYARLASAIFVTINRTVDSIAVLDYISSEFLEELINNLFLNAYKRPSSRTSMSLLFIRSQYFIRQLFSVLLAVKHAYSIVYIFCAIMRRIQVGRKDRNSPTVATLLFDLNHENYFILQYCNISRLASDYKNPQFVQNFGHLKL